MKLNDDFIFTLFVTAILTFVTISGILSIK